MATEEHDRISEAARIQEALYMGVGIRIEA